MTWAGARGWAARRTRGQLLSFLSAAAIAAYPAPARATPTFTLAWDPDETNGPVARYRVDRAPATAGPWALLKTTTTPTARVEVPCPAPGESSTRVFRIRQVDDLGQTGPPSEWLEITITVRRGP